MKLRILCLALFAGGVAFAKGEAVDSETYTIQVRGELTIQCPSSDGGKKAICDDKTGFVPDKAVLINEVVKLQIKNEPNPAGSKGLEGGWDKKVEYKGREFETAISLFKDDPSVQKYRLRSVVDSRAHSLIRSVGKEAGTPQTAILMEADKMKTINPFTLNYFLNDETGSIEYNVTVRVLN